MNKKTLLAILLLSVIATPVVGLAVAFEPGTPPTGLTLRVVISNALNVVWVVVAALAVVMIIAAGVTLMTAGGSPDKVATGRQMIIWALVGLAIAILGFSVQTILGFITTGTV
jgi:hypothetical protein